MSNSTILSLNFATQQVVIYGGSFFFVAGLISNSLALLVFLTLHTFRESSCAFYLTIMSFVNTVHLFTALLTYIAINGFGINWPSISLFYCKFRLFSVQLGALTSFSCMLLATLDQFCATCFRPRCQQLSNIKLARRLAIGSVIVWSLHGVPCLVFYNLVPLPMNGGYRCVITNAVYLTYTNTFHLPVLASTLPLVLIITFGLLAYRNVQQLAYRAVPLVRRELDKQLTVMVLTYICFDVIVVGPFVIWNILNAIYTNPTDPLFAAQLKFVGALFTTIYYLHFVVSFYIYMCVSKRFRQQLIYVLFRIHLNRCRGERGNNNQVGPEI